MNSKELIKGLYAIADNTFSPQYSHLELAQMYLVGGCRIIQLRMKNLAGTAQGTWHDTVFTTARDIMALKKKYDFTFIVNDFVDVAGEVKADGVHVGNGDMSIADIRKRLGDKIMVGYSSHSFEEALWAANGGASYVALGAIFPTKTKGPGHPVQGLDRLRKIVEGVNAPVVAIGGITRSNVGEVLSTGVASYAMITGLTQAPDVVAETKWYTQLA